VTCILPDSQIVLVGANDDVTFITAKFQVWVGSATPKTRPWTLQAASMRRVTCCLQLAIAGVVRQRRLGLSWEGARYGLNPPCSASMKGLGHSYCLPRDALDSVEVILSLLGCLQHSLQHLPLMGFIEQLHNAMSREVPVKTNLEAGV
jgi:hypothetical protein